MLEMESKELIGKQEARRRVFRKVVDSLRKEIKSCKDKTTMFPDPEAELRLISQVFRRNRSQGGEGWKK